MRKGFGLAVLLISALAGIHSLFPEWTKAKWREILAFTSARLEAELATVEELKSGRLQIGALPRKSPEQPEAVIYSIPVHLSPHKTPTSPHKTEHSPAGKSLAPATAPAPAPGPVSESPAPVQDGLSPTPPIAAAGKETPEASLGPILKHESRPEQMKQETFWTEEKIQEAIRNGAPKQRSAPCIAFCDKKDTVIEINTPE